MTARLRFNFDGPSIYREHVDGLIIERPENVPAAHRNTTVKWVKRCIRELAKKDYEIGFSAKQMRAGLRVKLKAEGYICTGGAARITMTNYVLRHQLSRFREYDSIAKDPTIGTIRDAEPEIIYAAIVAHEVAHHVQYRYGPGVRWLKNKYHKPHGKGWQEIYRILRREVVNPHL